MKAYFVGSITGKSRYLENYKRIVASLEKLGIEVFEQTLKPTEAYVQSLSDEGKVDFYRRVLEWINKADLVVAEGSYPSMGVGYEVSLAVEKGKPVIVLYEEGHAPHLVEGLKSEKVFVIKYVLKDLERILGEAIDYAAQAQDTRFNFFISPSHQNYLDWIARKRKTPRAVHLRRLLEKDMAGNKDYQQEVGVKGKGKK